MFSSEENSYLFYGTTNALTDFNELVDEAREGHNRCRYSQRVHGSSAVVRDELGTEDRDSAPVKHSFGKNSSHSSNLTAKGFFA
jgi:hypothetical protein